ncbi:MAG: flippase-like domain-containing protein [Bacteroidales bacterium]|nr:flippase-like domain-containing protein [Bacteroidales bacterium]
MEKKDLVYQTKGPGMKRKTLKKIAFYLMHSLGFILLYFVVRKLDFVLLRENLLQFRTWKIFLGLLILVGVYLIKSYRWYLINRAFGVKSRYGTLLVFYFASGFLSVITPGRLGEFAKIWFLNRKYQTGITVASSSVLLDRIWDVLVLSLMAGISMALLISRFQIDWFTVALIILIFVFALGVILLPGMLFRPVLALTRKRRIHSDVRQVYEVWKRNRFRFLLPGFITSLIAFGLLALMPFLFSVDLDAGIPYASSVTAVSISNILSFLPITIAGFGTRELVFTQVWAIHSHPAVSAIAISTIYFVVTYLGSLFIGGIIYLVWIRKFYSIQEIRNHEAAHIS